MKTANINESFQLFPMEKKIYNLFPLKTILYNKYVVASIDSWGYSIIPWAQLGTQDQLDTQTRPNR